MANTTANVTTGKPKIGGAMYRAPLGSTLPTDATTALDEAFKALGYVSEDGVTNTESRDTENIKAWGGDTVMNVLTGRDDTFKFTLIESMNEDVIKMVYGSANVTASAETGITIKAGANCDEEACYVIDMLLRGGRIKRVVIPDAKVSDVGDISYQDSEVTGYETTLTCLPDASGYTHYEYISKG